MRRQISNLLIDLKARRAFDVIDRVAYWRRPVLTARANRAFRAAQPGFAVPPLPILWDAQATTDLAEYKRSGEEAARLYWDLRGIPPTVPRAGALAQSTLDHRASAGQWYAGHLDRAPRDLKRVNHAGISPAAQSASSSSRSQVTTPS